MSHNYDVHCKCGASTEDRWNHAEEMLVAAVKASYPMYLADKSGWDVTHAKWNGWLLEGLASFLVDHFEHGGFVVKGEYSSDVPIEIKPECPAEVYESLVTKSMGEDLKKHEMSLKAMLADIEAMKHRLV